LQIQESRGKTATFAAATQALYATILQRLLTPAVTYSCTGLLAPTNVLSVAVVALRWLVLPLLKAAVMTLMKVGTEHTLRPQLRDRATSPQVLIL
jgi:hypothetical protein